MELFKAMDNLEEKQDKTTPTGEVEKQRCLIIGSGPAGYTAAIYAARANLSPVLYEGLQPGGQLTTTTDVENFPGYPEGISGPVMMEDLKKQAERFGTDTRWGIATKADFSKQPYKITIDDKHIIDRAVIYQVLFHGCIVAGYSLRSTKLPHCGKQLLLDW